MKSRIVVFLLAVALVISACGGGEAATATPKPQPTKAPEATKAPEPTSPPATEPAEQPTEEPEPTAEEVAYDLVVLPGTFQTQLGCDADWAPDCEITALTYDEASGTWVGTFDIAAGAYEYKVAINGSWDIAYPEGMVNLSLSLAEDAPVTFAFDPASKEVAVESEGLGEAPVAEEVAYEMVVLAGTMQAQLGCDADWVPDCDSTALTFDEASGTWVGTFDIAAGSYEYKVAMNGGWDITYPEGLAGQTLELAEDSPVTFTFDPAANGLVAESEGTAEGPAAAQEGGLVIWADMLVGPTLEKLVEDFEDEYGIPVTVESMGFGVVINTFNVAGPAGEGPDIIVAPHNTLGEFVTGGLVAPIDLGEKEADFYPATIQALTYNGELYGMPIATDNVAFVRNTEMVPEAPTTWDEVLEISRELTANNDDVLETNQYGFILQPGDGYHFFPIQNAFGGYIFGLNEDGSWNPRDVGLDSPGSIAAVEWLGQLLDEGLQPRDIDNTVVIEWFEAGRFAMGITGPWFLDRLRESGIPFEFSDLPAAEQPGQPFLGVGGFMVSAFSKEPLLAQIFLTEFVATEEVFGGLYEGEQRVYAYMPVMENIDDPDLAALAHAGSNGLPVPAIPEMNAAWSAWNGALTLIDQNADTPESAFTTAAEQIRAAITGE